MTDALYPNEAVPDEVKDSVEYGKSVGAYIEKQWFGKDNRYFNRRNEFQLLRSHMKGDVDISNFLDILGIDKDKSHIALNWQMPRVIAKFINNVVDSFSEEIYGIKAKGIDLISNRGRLVYTEELQKAMITQAFTQQFNQTFGMNAGPQGPVANSQEEIDLHMQLEYHPLSEIVAEESVKSIMDLNGYEELKKQVDEDLVLQGEGGIRVKRNGDKIIYERCVPENMIYSHDTLYSRDGRGTMYYGHVRAISIGDLRKFASSRGQELSDEDIKKMLASSAKYIEQYDHGDDNNSRGKYNDDQLTILIIDFCYKTTRHLTYKKKLNKHGGYKLIPKESGFEAPDPKKFDKVQSEYDVWYEGIYAVGTGQVYGYGLMDNQVRKHSNLKEPLQPIIYYRLSTESIGKRILPYVEQIYIVHMKIQQLISKMRPDGIGVDISALTDIDLLDGTKFTASELIQKFVQEGNLLYDGEKLDGSYNPRAPITDLPAPVSGKLRELVDTYLMWIQRIRDDTGINEVRDASTPSADSLVGVQKLSLAASLNSTKHISRGILDITKRLADATLLHLQSMVRQGVYSKQLTNAIGAYNANALSELVKMGNYEYQVKLELAPTAEEQARFDQEIQIALQSQKIDIEDIIDIRQVSNLSLARVMLKVKAKNKARAMSEMAQLNAKIEQDRKMADHEMEIQKDTILSRNKMQVDRNRALVDSEAKFQLEKGLLTLKMQYGDPEFQTKAKLQEQLLEGRRKIMHEQQDRMKERGDRTKTQESKIAKQKEENAEPLNFEATGNFSDLIKK